MNSIEKNQMKNTLTGLYQLQKILNDVVPELEEMLRLRGNDKLDAPLEELDLSVRAFNALYRMNIRKVGDILNYTQYDLSRFRHIGQQTLFSIVRKLEEIGVTLK